MKTLAMYPQTITKIIGKIKLYKQLINFIFGWTYLFSVLNERIDFQKRNSSVERGSVRVSLNKTYDDTSHINISTTANNYAILREKKKSFGNPKDFINYSNQNIVDGIDKSTSDSLLKLPQMRISNTRNDSINKTNSSNKDALSNLTPEQYIKLRNNGYFAGETFGAAPKVSALKISNFKGAQLKEMLSK